MLAFKFSQEQREIFLMIRNGHFLPNMHHFQEDYHSNIRYTSFQPHPDLTVEADHRSVNSVEIALQ